MSLKYHIKSHELHLCISLNDKKVQKCVRWTSNWTIRKGNTMNIQHKIFNFLTRFNCTMCLVKIPLLQRKYLWKKYFPKNQTKQQYKNYENFTTYPLLDFDLKKYRKLLMSVPPGKHEVCFVGKYILDYWKELWLHEKPRTRVNRGITSWARCILL